MSSITASSSPGAGAELMIKKWRMLSMPMVKQIDIKGIFERAAGHNAVTKTVIICGSPKTPEIGDSVTLNGIQKPMSFTVTPKRKEEFFI